MDNDEIYEYINGTGYGDCYGDCHVDLYGDCHVNCYGHGNGRSGIIYGCGYDDGVGYCCVSDLGKGYGYGQGYGVGNGNAIGYG